MRSFTLIYVVLILLGSCVQAAPNGDNIGSQEGVDRIASQESTAFDRYEIEYLNCTPYLDAIKEIKAAYDRQMRAQGSDFFKLLDDETAQTGRLLDEFDQCQVEAEARLKTQLWGNIVEVNSSHAQTPPNWSKISSQNYNAITRYRSEAKACSDRYLAGDEAFNPDQMVEALGKVERCQIEAAASLKAQLQSP